MEVLNPVVVVDGERMSDMVFEDYHVVVGDLDGFSRRVDRSSIVVDQPEFADSRLELFNLCYIDLTQAQCFDLGLLGLEYFELHSLSKL